MKSKGIRLARNSNNIAVALLLAIEPLCYILPFIGIGSYYLDGYALAAVSLLLSLYNDIAINRGKAFRFRKLPFYYCIFVILVFALTKALTRASEYGLSAFIYYFLISAYVICRGVDVEKVLKYLTVISVISIPAYNSIFAYQFVTLNQASMGAVYSVFLLASAAVLHFVFYRKQEKRWFYIFYVPAIVLLFGIITYSNRGTILALLVLIIALALNQPKYFRGEARTVYVKKRLWMFLLIILGFVIVINYSAIFYVVYGWVSRLTTNVPSFFIKMEKYIRLSDISNGRSDVYRIAWESIKNNFAFGRGIETFSVNTGLAYPHNFVLQLLYEGGILFTVVPTLMVITIIIKIFFSQMKNKSLCVFYILLTVQVIPRFLISADIWTSRFFWILVFSILYNWNILKKERNSNENTQTD